MDNLIIIGGGGHAKVIVSILKKVNQFRLIGYVDKVDRGEILGVKYIGTDEVLEKLFINGDVSNAALGIGQLKDTSQRRDIVSRVSRIGYSFPRLISPDAVINEDVEISDGTVIMDGVVINSGTRIGRFCIINTRASIDHDCRIGDYTHIAPGATLSGGVEVGSDVLIGVGASIVQYKKIVDNVIIGAGSAVCQDVIDQGTYGGIPARKIGK